MKFLFDQDVPDDLAHLLHELGHEIVFVRDVMDTTSADAEVLAYARGANAIMVTCNRDDFLALAEQQPHQGIVIVIRRQSRLSERAAFFRLVERAGESGLSNNINFPEQRATLGHQKSLAKLRHECSLAARHERFPGY